MRSFWIAWAAVAFVWALPAGGQETAKSAFPPLPEGDAGISAKYPGDVGIEKDPAVVFVDRFEDNTDQWEFRYGDPHLTHDPENVRSGKGSLELMVDWSKKMEGASTNRGLVHFFEPGFDVMHLRYYTKLGKDTELFNGHNGPAVAAYRRDLPMDGTAGLPADGCNKFTARLDIWRPREAPSPGYLTFYSYFPEQSSRYGDHIFPSGRVEPLGRPPEVFFGKEFVSRPDIVPERGQWFCCEIMVKANTPGRHDGRMAFWVDGKLGGDFPNFLLRDVDSLKINEINVGLYVPLGRSQSPCMEWHDDLVVATSYIGPMVEAKTTPTEP